MALVKCLSESWLDYNASHQGKYVDICGVNPKIWGDYLDEKGIQQNSLKAGITVYKYYLEKYNSKRMALLKYKGVSKNKKVVGIVDKVIRLEKEYRDRINNIFRKKD